MTEAAQAAQAERARQYYAAAEKLTTIVPDVPADTPALPIASVGVIGAGTMGGGIAMNFLNAGIPVTLVDMAQASLERGLGVIRRNYENAASKGRLTTAQVEERMALITPTIDIGAVAGCDLVIEAVFEQMTIKQDVFARLDAVCRPGAILASNTSFLDLDEIASATGRPEWVIGMHFFSPANVMRLLEVVRGSKTSKEVIATVMKLGGSIGKVSVLSRVCQGFIANRVMIHRGMQADQLILRGPTPQDIDRAMNAYGFAMGPFQMIDLVGLNVVMDDGPSVRGELVAMGRLGQKQNGGFYDYDAERKATPSPVAAKVIADFAASRGISPIGPISEEEIIAHLLFPVVNEGAKVLEEGIAIRASDIDVACILGYGWPLDTGGPMFWADTVGLAKIVEGLTALGIEPSRLLAERAAGGGSFTRG